MADHAAAHAHSQDRQDSAVIAERHLLGKGVRDAINMVPEKSNAFCELDAQADGAEGTNKVVPSTSTLTTTVSDDKSENDKGSAGGSEGAKDESRNKGRSNPWPALAPKRPFW